MRRSPLLTGLILAGALLPLACSSAGEGKSTVISDGAVAAEDMPVFFAGLGECGREVTSSSALARMCFDQGLCFLYAFNHDEAARSFETAAQLDPGCAMAHWGIVMAQGPHINRTQVSDDGRDRALLAIATARIALDNESDVERALVEAVAVRHARDKTRAELDRAFAAAMRQVRQRFPDDPDVGALFAESLMDLRPWDLYTGTKEARPETPEIVATLESVIAAHPRHPLALHLYIHAVEASTDPGRADAAADRLRDLQPGLGHMVHMPSHIDVLRGRWEKAVEANQKAIVADTTYRARASEQAFYRIYMAHNHHMLAFAAMMRGQSGLALAAARGIFEAMPADWARKPANAPIADGFLALEVEIGVRFGRWEEVLTADDPGELYPIARAMRLFGRGVALAAKGEAAVARIEQTAFRAAVAALPKGATFGNNPAAAILAVADNLLEGEILLAEGSVEPGLAALRAAVLAEDQLRYDEPPNWIHPVRHSLGAFLVKLGRFAAAEAVYREDLERWPENGWSLVGLQACHAGSGRTDEAAATAARAREILKDADVVIGSSCFCAQR